MKRIAVFGALLAALVVGLTASSASAVPLMSLPVEPVPAHSLLVARDQCIEPALDAHREGAEPSESCVTLGWEIGVSSDLEWA